MRTTARTHCGPPSFSSPPSPPPQCGRLQAMLDQQRAGNVGGTGAVAQFVFTGMGLGLVLLFFFFAGMTLLGQLTMGQFFAAGVWLPALGGPLCFVRVYFLCKLNLQETGSLHSKLVR